jgi:hypothetical protein
MIETLDNLAAKLLRTRSKAAQVDFRPSVRPIYRNSHDHLRPHHVGSCILLGCLPTFRRHPTVARTRGPRFYPRMHPRLRRTAQVSAGKYPSYRLNISHKAHDSAGPQKH